MAQAVTYTGSLEGAAIGTFVVPSGTASGTAITVSDSGCGANSQVLLQQQGFGGTALQVAVTAVAAGSFTVTTQSTGNTTANATVTFLRTG